ncbi:CesT family type III secretion system chaperone [Grimontia marina]|uniref:Chaperone protein SycT n=1 Tax=Grimontia marina TaxID=646534 RepID=A0A128FHQ3_9GAMM|nr:CesT family type III secretion system chaperone [Grimontia marina]CZF86329.1 Chaperone protein SycT [Grimontia marina]
MITTFDYLVTQLFEKNGIESSFAQDDIYSLLIDQEYQIQFTHQNEELIILYADLGEISSVSEQLAKNNMYGEYWPAHIVSHRENRAVLWSQQPISMLNVAALESWTEYFIQDMIEKKAAISDVEPNPENTQPSGMPPNMIAV